MKELVFHTNELRSLAIARHFQLQGQHPLIINRKKKFSFDDSFLVGQQLFDCGYHAIDIGRTEEWSNVLESLKIDWIESDGNRSVVVLGKMLPRNYEASCIADLISNKNFNKYTNPFLHHLETLYGSEFIDYCLSEIVKSYVQNTMWEKANLKPEILLKNIYPWFFPSNINDEVDMIETHFHHSKSAKRSSAYPATGGFFAITNILRSTLQENIIQPVVEDGSLFSSFDEKGYLIGEEAKKSGIHLVSVDYQQLAEQFSFAYPEYAQTNFYLISIVLDREIEFKQNEILLGDPNYLFDRITSPDVLEHKAVRRIQFEAESLEELVEAQLLENAKLFMTSHLQDCEFVHVDIKKVKIKRFADVDFDLKTKKILNFIEDRNPNVIVMNRSLNFENLADTVKNLILITQRKLNEDI